MQSFAGVCTDPEGDPITYKLLVNGNSFETDTPGDYVRFNAATSTFTFTYANIGQQLSYTISVVCSDGVDSR